MTTDLECIRRPNPSSSPRQLHPSSPLAAPRADQGRLRPETRAVAAARDSGGCAGGTRPAARPPTPPQTATGTTSVVAVSMAARPGGVETPSGDAEEGEDAASMRRGIEAALALLASLSSQPDQQWPELEAWRAAPVVELRRLKEPPASGRKLPDAACCSFAEAEPDGADESALRAAGLWPLGGDADGPFDATSPPSLAGCGLLVLRTADPLLKVSLLNIIISLPWCHRISKWRPAPPLWHFSVAPTPKNAVPAHSRRLQTVSRGHASALPAGRRRAAARMRRRRRRAPGADGAASAPRPGGKRARGAHAQGLGAAAGGALAARAGARRALRSGARARHPHPLRPRACWRPGGPFSRERKRAPAARLGLCKNRARRGAALLLA